MICQMTTISFQEWLNEQLRLEGWTQADLARIAKVDGGVISRLLTGERSPKPETLVSIAKAFRLPPEQLFRIAGVLPSHSINERSTRLAYRISQLPAEDQETIDAMIDGLYNRRKNRGEIIDLPDNAAPGET